MGAINGSHLWVKVSAMACPYSIVRFGVLQHPPYKVGGVCCMMREFCNTLS